MLTRNALLTTLLLLGGCGEHAASTLAGSMSSHYELPAGIEVPNLTGIAEAYSIRETDDGYHVITINVSAENISSLFHTLAERVVEPGFLLIETGTHRDIEETLRDGIDDAYHKDVHYIDGLTWNSAKGVLRKYEFLFVNDGGVNFGFGSHEGHDEVFVDAYKIFYIYANDPSKYEKVLREHGYPMVKDLRTVWDTFTPDAPGQCRVLTDESPNIWEMVEDLRSQGLYLSERRER